MLELLAILLMCLVLGVPGQQSGTSERECAQLSVHGQYLKHRVTDGKELVTSKWDGGKQLLSCFVSKDEGKVSSFLSRCTNGRGEDEWYHHFGGFAEARMVCEFFLQSNPPESSTKSKDHHTRVKRGFTYPGTLWCGAGDNAEDEDDLGEHRETDSCCRTHDKCEHVIHPFTKSYGYKNLLWHTLSHCQCDSKFKDCLRRVNDTASRVVGQAFFNVIQVQCFDFRIVEQCVEWTWYGWCNKYANVTMAVPRDSGLYDYGGKLIDKPILSKETPPTQPPSVEMSTEQPTLGQVLQATENLLKIMMSVSPSTSPNQPKVDTTDPPKKKKDKTKKERKNKKGKGLKGKKKNNSEKKNTESPGKEIWGEKIVKNKETTQNLPLDILELDSKKNGFNDILNDEPIRNGEAKTSTPVSPMYIKEELKAITSPPPVSRPCIQKPQRKNRRKQKGSQQRKKNPKKQPCGPSPTP
ncbi:protein PROCA1 [Hyperolius riggenbachi]|uniref:protein PROCA1 n=1 Tax=Hyperolius riggenbachi TaxID=752182 RepID=UPI0035A33A36